MHAEDALAHHCAHRQVVEGFCDGLERLYPHFSLALVVEAVGFIELAGLMVASQQEKGQRVLDFAGHQQADRLQ